MINYTAKLFFGVALCGVFSQSALADSNALYIDAESHVGIGIANPTTKLHVSGADGLTQLLVEETGTLGARNMFKIANNGPTRFQFENTDSGEKWTFNSAVGQLRIAHSGTGATAGTEFTVFSNGNATLAGALTQSSDVNAKQDIEAIDHRSVLAKVMELPIAEWSYKDAPASRHIGPTAQDFYNAFGLGHTDKGLTSIDTAGVALAAIQGVKQEKDTEIAKLKAENLALQGELNQLRAEQQERMLQLEMALSEVLRNQSPEVQVGSAN